MLISLKRSFASIKDSSKSATQRITLPLSPTATATATAAGSLRVPVVALNDLSTEIAKQTLRALARDGVVGSVDANKFFTTWQNDSELHERDFLEAFLTEQNTKETDMDAIAASLHLIGTPVVTHCDFLGKLGAANARPRDEFEFGAGVIFKKHHCRLLNYHQEGNLTSLVIGVFNPIAGALVGAWVRSQGGRAGASKPYVGLLRLSLADWRLLAV